MMRNAEYAREIIATMEKETKSRAARKRMAEAALIVGKYDEAAKQVWREYLETFK